MIRSVLSVLAGTVSWTVLWLSLNSLMQSLVPAAFGADGSVARVDVLLVILAASVVFSIIAGYVTAWLVPGREMGHALALGILQLAIGIFVQSQAWNLLPVWYHLSFLALLVPGNLLGGFWRRQGRPPA